MSSNLMQTEKGGEQTQYEGEHTHMHPHKKSGGQLGTPQTAVDTNPDAEAQRTAEQGEKAAEKIRYGQGISESGMGGMTTAQMGEADATADGAARRENQGYDEKNSMRDDVGA